MARQDKWKRGLQCWTRPCALWRRRGNVWTKLGYIGVRESCSCSVHQKHQATDAGPQWREAEACFQQALAVARRQQARTLELRTAMSLARLWQRQGKGAAARELLAPNLRLVHRRVWHGRLARGQGSAGRNAACTQRNTREA